jgi:hypothetical protein
MEEKFMLAVKGTYQNGQLFLQEQVPFTQPVTVIVTFLEEVDHKIPSNSTNPSITDNQLLGLFAHESEGQVTLCPVKRDIAELEGFLQPPPKPISLEEMDAVICRRGSE